MLSRGFGDDPQLNILQCLSELLKGDGVMMERETRGWYIWHPWWLGEDLISSCCVRFIEKVKSYVSTKGWFSGIGAIIRCKFSENFHKLCVHCLMANLAVFIRSLLALLLSTCGAALQCLEKLYPWQQGHFLKAWYLWKLGGFSFQFMWIHTTTHTTAHTLFACCGPLFETDWVGNHCEHTPHTTHVYIVPHCVTYLRWTHIEGFAAPGFVG